MLFAQRPSFAALPKSYSSTREVGGLSLRDISQPGRITYLCRFQELDIIYPDLRAVFILPDSIDRELVRLTNGIPRIWTSVQSSAHTRSMSLTHGIGSFMLLTERR